MIWYEEDYLCTLVYKLDGSVAIRASIFAFPASILAVLLIYLDEWFPGRRDDLGLSNLNSTQVWNSVTIVSGILLAFRTKQALSRFWEGTSLLHQMRGEWFDTVSNVVTFSISAKAKDPPRVDAFRHTIVRLMSLAHGSALEEIAGDGMMHLDTIDIAGLDEKTLRHVKECNEIYGFNKVEVLLHLVQSVITKAFDDKILDIPPPILSRVYQTISRGFVNLLNAKKITDTRFPFPYAQTMAFMLFSLVITTPMIIASVLQSKVLAAIFTFIPVFSFSSLNFIATELENPFGHDPNDLPLATFQRDMNKCLLMLLHHNTDIVATIGSTCMMDFKTLYTSICHSEFDDVEDTVRNTRLSDMMLSPATSIGNSEVPNKVSSSLRDGAVSQPAAEPAVGIGVGVGTAFALGSRPNLTKQSLTGISLGSDAAEMKGEVQFLLSTQVAPMPSSQDAKEPPTPSREELLQVPSALFETAPQPAASLPRSGFLKSLPRTAELGSATSLGYDTSLLASKVGYIPCEPILEDGAPVLGMEAFNRSMRRWTEMIEQQVYELNRNCKALQILNDSMNAPNGWERALIGV